MSSPRGTVSGRRLANRKEVLDELAASEGKYLKKLKSLAQAYMIPLNDARVLTAGELTAIFRGLVDMANVHAKLAGVLVSAAEEDNVAQGMAIVSDEFRAAKAALLELYVGYGRGHDAALRCLRTALARPDVARACDAIAAGDERVRGLALQDLLAAPLDRIAEYRELLSALAAYSSPADRGFPGLQEATDLLSAVLRDAVANGYAPPSAAPAAAASSMGGSGVFGAAPGAAGAASSSGGVGMGVGVPSAATQALVAAAMPMPMSMSMTHAHDSSAAAAASPAAASGAGAGDGHLSTEAVLSAQAEAEEASRRLEALEREVSLRESELALTSREVARAEAEKARRLVPGGGSSAAAAAAEAGPLEEALRSLGEEERELLSRVSGSEHRALFEAFLARKRELEEEEARLSEALEEHEDTLAKVRARLANPPQSVLPADPAKASLYIAWKRALAEREELLRQARRRKHELLRDLKARHETQVVLLELERRAAVEGLRESVAGERAKVEGYKADLAALDESIEAARSAMTRFRQEFEQLRVALLIDRMAKSSQVANLADRRRRLAREAEQFAEAVEAAKQRVAAEEASKWEARLAAEKAAGEARVGEERAAIEAKIERVRGALAERYEAGFKPLLAEAEARHVEELNRIVALQRELEAKEAELRSAQESARAVSAAVSALTGASTGDDAVASSSSSGAGATGEEAVPDWKLREFADLRNAVASMWEQLDVPAEDVAAFLSECDLLAPFSPAVLSMYQDMYRRLTNAAAAAAVAATAPALAGGSAPGSPASPAHLGAAPAGRAAAAAAAAVAAGSPGGHGHGGHGGYDGESSSSAAARANALAAQYEEASAAAAARARAAATALAAAPLAMTVSSSAGSDVMATPSGAGAPQARGRTPASNPASAAGAGAGNSGAFRSTLFSSSGGRGSSDEAEAQAYLARLAASRTQLPPSLGGPGARSAQARGGSIHVSAGEGMIRRSPSPSAGRYGAPYGAR